MTDETRRDSNETRTALTIAGSDSGGGAGIQADLKTFAALGVYGMSAITAITAQNTVTVIEVLALPPRLVVAQIDAVVDDLPVHAVKIGMLATAEIATAVGATLARHGLPHVVLDTVMVAKGGAELVDDSGVLTIVKQTGSQRPAGRLWNDDDPNRLIFLGSLALGDEKEPLAYAEDPTRDMAGVFERIAPFRWRLVIPWPQDGAKLQVFELTPVPVQPEG